MLVNDGLLSLVVGLRGTVVPSHVLYADDVMIFCRENLFNLKAHKNLFLDYGEVFCQINNNFESTIYVGFIKPRRKAKIVDLLGFHFREIPFTYLGTPILKGKSKTIHFMPIANRIKI